MVTTSVQASEHVRKIASMFPTGALANESARQQYIDVLVGMDDETTKEAIHQCFLTNKYCPTIADIKSTYQTLLQRANMSKAWKVIKCSGCGGSGVYPYTKVQEDTAYQYVAYCSCEAGQRYNISTKDGQVYRYDDIFQGQYVQNADEFEGVPIEEIRGQIRKFLMAAQRWK